MRKIRHPRTFAVDPQTSAVSFKGLFQQERRCDDNTVPETVDDIFRIGAVPDTDDQIDDKSRQRRGQNLSEDSAEMFSAELSQLHERFRQRDRIKYIIPHPGTQSDMPSAPVIRHGIGENRPPEIFCKIDAEKMRHAPGGIIPPRIRQ